MSSQTRFERPSVQAWAGTVCLFSAAVLIMLAVIQRTRPLEFMPRSWHASPALWYLIMFGLFLAGVRLLWSQRETRDPESIARRQTPVFDRVVLYTRENCPLCDEAKATLAEFRHRLPEVEEIDIDADPGWKEKYDTCVPVVEIDDKLRFRGQVNRALLQRLIEANAEGRD